MRPKERMIAALNHSLPDDYVPSWDIEFQIYQQAADVKLVVGKEFDALTDKEKEKAVYHNAVMMTEAAALLSHSCIALPLDYWEFSAGLPAHFWLRGEKWRLMLARCLAELAGKDYFLIGVLEHDPVISMPGANAYEFSYAMYDDPEQIDKIAEKKYLEALGPSDRMLEAGVDALLCATDFAFNNGSFFSPEHFERFILPYLAKWARLYGGGEKYTILHSDGEMSKLLPYVAEAGISAFQCVDPVAGMRMDKSLDDYCGKLAMIGNINTVTLHHGTIEDAEAECKDVLLACRSKTGFVFGTCNAVYDGIPTANYLKMIEMKRIFGVVTQSTTK